MPRRAPKNVFDPGRTDRDEPASAPPPPLSDLLPRLDDHAAPAVAPASPPELAPAPRRSQIVSSPQQEAAPQSRPSRPRGVGGRPQSASTPARITSVAARVPADAYAAALPLVKGVGRPSWGQLIAWTCQDHPDAVIAQAHNLVLAEHGTRTPRGQNKHGRATTQVTARFTPDELATFETTLDAARASVNESQSGAAMTATTVLVAAILVASQQ